MTPVLDCVRRGAEAAEPPKEAHPEHVEDGDPNPAPHVTNDTPSLARRDDDASRLAVPVPGCVARVVVRGDLQEELVQARSLFRVKGSEELVLHTL